MAAPVIIETADNRLYRVTETGSPDLAHVWNGVRVKIVKGQVVDLKSARTELVRKAYSNLVLGAFDDLEHADKREFLDRKAAVENASRQRL